MRIFSWALCAVLVSWPFAVEATPKNRVHEKVEVDGCLVQDDNGCVYLKTGTRTFDVSSANPKMDPKQHLGVALVARIASPGSMCKRGIPLDNIKWSYTKQVCP
jgi:hypothetical protein